jgi:hypothetical protein
MIYPDTVNLAVGGAAIVALAILLVSVPMSLIAFWRASAQLVGSGNRWEVFLRSRWVGSNARVAELLTAEGQRKLRQAIHWQRISMVGLGIAIVGVFLGVAVGG